MSTQERSDEKNPAAGGVCEFIANVGDYDRVWVPSPAYARWFLIGPRPRPCRYTVGPNRKQCGKPAVAELDRSHDSRTHRRWGYCGDHLFGRRLHGDHIDEWRLVAADQSRSPASSSLLGDS